MINNDANNQLNNYLAVRAFHDHTPEINSLSVHLKNLTIRTVPGLLEYQWSRVNDHESTPWLADLQRRVLLGHLPSLQTSRNRMYGAIGLTIFGMNLLTTSTDPTSSLLLGRLGVVAGSFAVAAGATYTASVLNMVIVSSFNPKDWLNNLYRNA